MKINRIERLERKIKEMENDINKKHKEYKSQFRDLSNYINFHINEVRSKDED